MISISSRRQGAWLVIIGKHLLRFDITELALSELDNLSFAGKCGALLIKLSADDTEQLFRTKVIAHARLCGIGVRELSIYLDTLKAFGCLDWDKENNIFEVLAFSRERVLDTTSTIFLSSTPSKIEKIIANVLEFCLIRPRFASEIKENIASEISEKNVEHLLSLIKTFDLLGHIHIERVKEDLFFNGYQFGDRAEDIGKALGALPKEHRESLDELIDIVSESPGTPPENIKVSKKIKTLTIGLGLIDENKVQSIAGEASFLTKPGFSLPSVGKEVSNLEDDVFNHAKMLLSSLRYGEFRSTMSRGRIIDPKWIIGALMDRDQVGPCTAIGQDYVALEGEGVIRTIRAEHRFGEQFYMELRRSEPAEIVMNLLKSGKDPLIDVKSLPRNLELPISYTGPEVARPQAATKIVFQDPETIKRFYEELRT